MEQQFVTQLGSQVYTARTAQGLTQSMLATRAGVSERLIRYLEKGQAQSVQLNKLLAILSALGLDLSICTQREAGQYVSGESEHRAPQKPSLYESTVDDQEYEALLQKAVSSWLDEAVMTYEG